MSLSKLLATPSPFLYGGVTYLIPPWTYDVQAAFESYFRSEAWKNLKKLVTIFSDEEYREEKSALRRDIDSGKYDFGNEIIQSALDNPKHQKELIYLGLVYSNREKGITRDLVEEIYNDEEAKKSLLEVIMDVNTDPNQKRLTNSTPSTEPPAKD